MNIINDDNDDDANDDDDDDNDEYDDDNGAFADDVDYDDGDDDDDDGNCVIPLTGGVQDPAQIPTQASKMRVSGVVDAPTRKPKNTASERHRLG